MINQVVVMILTICFMLVIIWCITIFYKTENIPANSPEHPPGLDYSWCSFDNRLPTCLMLWH